MASKPRRHASILRLVRDNAVTSQEMLRELLGEEGFDVAQGTLSRDIRELGLAKLQNSAGLAVYTAPPDVTDPTPTLSRLLPPLFVGAEGTGNLLVIRTVVGGAQPIAVAIDHEEWPEVLGTIAGDDTILLVLRKAGQMKGVRKRIEGIAGIDE